ncbi:unnamed protein product [Trichobilharzia szidati]|nr:unnamed protein product [Trichobilharzia szidati]
METDEQQFNGLLGVLEKINVYVNTLRSRLESEENNSLCDIPLTLEECKLRDYQILGYRWIRTLYENGMNGILADEMGLGKTVQVIAGLADLIESGVSGPFLIIAPLSLISVWSDQLATFAPRLPCMVYYGSMKERLELRKFIRKRIHISLDGPIKVPLFKVYEKSQNNDTVAKQPQCNEGQTVSSSSDNLSYQTSSFCSELEEDNSVVSLSVSSCSLPSYSSAPKRMRTYEDEMNISQNNEMKHSCTDVVDSIISEVLSSIDDHEEKNVLKENSSPSYTEEENFKIKIDPEGEKMSADETEKGRSDCLVNGNIDVPDAVPTTPVENHHIENNCINITESPSSEAIICDNVQLQSARDEYTTEDKEHMCCDQTETVDPCISNSSVEEDCVISSPSKISSSSLQIYAENENSSVPPEIPEEHTDFTVGCTQDDVPTDLNSPCLIDDKASSDSLSNLPLYHLIALAHLDDIITNVINDYQNTNVETVADCEHSESSTNTKVANDIFTSCIEEESTTEKVHIDQTNNDLSDNHDLQQECHFNIDSHYASSIYSTSNSSTSKEVNSSSFKTCPIILTTFDVALRDAGYLKNVPFKALIIDEGHRLKNPLSKLYKCLTKFSVGLRLLVTGTPLQNRLSELWSLLHFILPEIFTSLAMFESWFDPAVLCNASGQNRLVAAEMESSLITKLHQIIHPFILRRSKIEVNLKLPPKKEIVLRVNMSPIQKKLYDYIVDILLKNQNLCDLSALLRNKSNNYRVGYTWTCIDKFNILEESVIRRKPHRNKSHSPRVTRSISSKISPTEMTLKKEPTKTEVDSEFVLLPNISLNNGFMLLRRIVNHPFLVIERPSSLQPESSSVIIPGSPNNICGDSDNMSVEKEDMSILTVEQKELIEASGKTRLLDRLLKQLIGDGHKVVVFSQFTMILDLLEELLDSRSLPFVRIDGSTRIYDRQNAIRRFNLESVEQLPVFLISTKAGGCGINLQTAADTVIIFDSDWNPQSDLQAQDRCHRIGQTKPVLVIRLITNESIDESILQRAQAKRGLERLILNHRVSSLDPSLYDKSLQFHELMNTDEKEKNEIDATETDEVDFQPLPISDDPLCDKTNLTKSELIDLLKQTDHQSDVLDACSLTDEELNKLLDRSDLIETWGEYNIEEKASSINECPSSSPLHNNTPMVNEYDNLGGMKIDQCNDKENLQILEDKIMFDKVYNESMPDLQYLEHEP